MIKRKSGKQSSIDGLESGDATDSMEHLGLCCLDGLYDWKSHELQGEK